jgi:hypothetical protein
MEPEGSLPCSQEPAIGSYLSQMHEFTSFHPISQRFILVYPPIYA